MFQKLRFEFEVNGHFVFTRKFTEPDAIDYAIRLSLLGFSVKVFEVFLDSNNTERYQLLKTVQDSTK